MSEDTDHITPRQAELLWLLARGLNMAQAAKTMLISYSTARTQLYYAKESLGLHENCTITHIVVVAVTRGLIDPDRRTWERDTVDGGPPDNVRLLRAAS